MEFMKEINTLANEYVPPEPQIQEDVRIERMIKSMTPPKAKKEKKEKVKKTSIKLKMEDARAEHEWY